MSTYDVEIWPDKKSMRIVYFTSLTALVLCIIAVVMAEIYWDDVVQVRRTALTGKIVRTGWPVSAFWWGAGIGVGLVLVFGMLWGATKRNTPSLAVSSDHLLVNQQLFKAAKIKWDEIRKITWEAGQEGAGPSMQVYLKDAAAVVKRMPILARPFLKSSYVRADSDDAPLNFDNKFTAGELEKLYKRAQGHLNNGGGDHSGTDVGNG